MSGGHLPGHGEEIGDDGAGCGQFAGARAGEKQGADGRGFEVDGIQHAIHRRELMRALDQGRINGGENASIGVLGNHAKKLDDIAELGGHGDVERRDSAYAFDMQGAIVDGASISERSEKRNLVQGVESVDVEGGIGFGITEALGFGQGGLEGGAFLRHLGEDVIAGAIDDAGEALDVITDEALLQGLDDGYAAADCGFEGEKGVVLGSQWEEAGAMFGQQGFIGGDDMLARLEGGLDGGQGGVFASSDFDENVDVRVGGHSDGVGGEEGGGRWGHQGGCAIERRLVAGTEGDNFEVKTEGLGEETALVTEQFEHALANRAHAEYSDANVHQGKGSREVPKSWLFENAAGFAKGDTRQVENRYEKRIFAKLWRSCRR
jgi:hypothetical protein